ncbi:RICIN domain-containing protein [Nonomuraea aurantiaca]|uniref:RICIN domain-containing protein n=1 Tax=Nonomuraea aurantiaca TaxID=2878562 RepID=UPI001CD98AB7|nr:RICIN domain-containing protein [Nonomuraea aurantiaca]MCA2229028.1 RICIN domain-containing protein [Nonomuraea aurantiaca]
MLARHLLAAAVISTTMSAITALPAMAAGQEPANRTVPVGTAMCVDVSNNRGNGTLMYQWQCDPNNANQKFAIEDGQIAIKDTLS